MFLINAVNYRYFIVFYQLTTLEKCYKRSINTSATVVQWIKIVTPPDWLVFRHFCLVSPLYHLHIQHFLMPVDRSPVAGKRVFFESFTSPESHSMPDSKNAKSEGPTNAQIMAFMEELKAGQESLRAEIVQFRAEVNDLNRQFVFVHIWVMNLICPVYLCIVLRTRREMRATRHKQTKLTHHQYLSSLVLWERNSCFWTAISNQLISIFLIWEWKTKNESTSMSVWRKLTCR